MNDLISIIIPVFNVKEYLDRCMRSAVSQTYTNLEIILVDDGSTDGSGPLCDLWSSKDSRIKVIHKENEGVAAARNEGLAVAEGDYIGFADPDDWMESTMFEVLLNVIKRFNADIAICGFEEIKQTGTRIKQVAYTRCYTREEALYELVRDADVQSYVWNKLFCRKCVPVNPFPGIRSISDLAGIYKFFQKAETVIQINQPLYHYIRREGSLVGKDAAMESHTNYCLAKQSQFEGLSGENEKIRSLAAKSYVKALHRLKEMPAPSGPVPEEKCFQIIENAILPFYVSHLAALRDVKGFTTEKERELTSFLQDPGEYSGNSRNGTKGDREGKALKGGNDTADKVMLENCHLRECLLEKDFTLQKKNATLKKYENILKEREKTIARKDAEIKTHLSSFRYQAGTFLYEATRSVKAFLLLPVKLIKLFLKYKKKK